MKADVISKKSIKVFNQTVNLTIIAIIMLLLAYAGYALWDLNQIHNAASKSHYAKYKPSEKNEGKSFKELQALNPEVIAWLSVYGTNIDYPVTQGSNNMKYVDINAEGRYSLSGAIFLDWSNSRHFDDFNSILYGHHMEKKAMFGEIGEFAKKDIFDSHRYGNLYFNGKDYGIETFAFIHTDAYDFSIFHANVSEENRQAYLDNLLAKAMYTRDIGVTIYDNIVLLSTCSSTSTNGRDILVGRLTEETHEDPYANDGTDIDRDRRSVNIPAGAARIIPIWSLVVIILLLTRFIVLIPAIRQKREKVKRKT